MSVPKCGSCRQVIEWVMTVDGRRVPLDPAPAPRHGTVWVNPESGRARFLSKDERRRAVDKGYVIRAVHHQTCPSVERHRVPRAQLTLDVTGGES